MATQTKTLLDGVNDALTMGRLIQGQDQRFTSLTSSQYQNEIDNMVIAINQVIGHIYDTESLQPDKEAEGTVTLVTSTREYTFPADYESMVSDTLLNVSDGYQIFRYPGTYEHLLQSQLTPSSYTGRPFYWTINPTNGNLYLDTLPTVEDNGIVYRYLYEKSISLEAFDDTFPFSDEVYKILVPSFKEYWQSDAKDKFNETFFISSTLRAVDKIRGFPLKTSY